MRLDILRSDMVAVCVGERRSDESVIEVVVYDASFELGEPDRGRMTNQGSFESFDGKLLGVRVFSLASGCGVNVQGGKLKFAEGGLQGLQGRSVTVIDDSLRGDMIVIVWRDTELRNEVPVREKVEMINKLSGLRCLFC